MIVRRFLLHALPFACAAPLFGRQQQRDRKLPISRIGFGFNAKALEDPERQLEQVAAAFARLKPEHVRNYTIRVTGGTRSQKDMPGDWPVEIITRWIALQRRFGFRMVFVVNGRDTPENQAAFIAHWLKLGARFAFVEMMNEFYLRRYREGDTSLEEVSRKVTARDYVEDILPTWLPEMERLGLPIFVICAPDKQEGPGPQNYLKQWNIVVTQALRTSFARKRLGVTTHLYAE